MEKKQTNKLNEKEETKILGWLVVCDCSLHAKRNKNKICGIITLHIYPVCTILLSLFRFTFVIHTETVTLIVVTLNTMNTTIAFGIDLLIE